MKNIVICCDGTGNQIGMRTSNVLKLFRSLVRDDRQVTFYDPGVGSIVRAGLWNTYWQDFNVFRGLATGWGFDASVLRAYRFLIRNFEAGDKIYLFGFSRGAYTVRAVAALIRAIGLLRLEQDNLAEYAWTELRASNSASADLDTQRLAQFQRFAGGRDVHIAFMGVWDTVNSVIVPWLRWGFLPGVLTLPFTATNNRVKVFRHAISIDERRRFFRLNKWNPGQQVIDLPIVSGAPAYQPQDRRELWFAGVHSDVGGGYPEDGAGLAKFPLVWMVGEATAAGLLIEQAVFDHVAYGRHLHPAEHNYAAPDANAKPHGSLTAVWWPLEFVPKRARWREWPGRRSAMGFYLPLGEPRVVPDDAMVHESVKERMAGSPYKPKNLPGTVNFVPR